ncbi:CHAT domain-containing protein [Streptomyces sp. NPDC050504]|uniref:CHAT domain-containing protein n=1 Tax=Streptomyces sp. NPDC050504 TaxID=3365618 RepID=UPI003790B47E
MTEPVPRELPVRVVQDPSRGFTLLGHRTARAPDLTVTLMVDSSEKSLQAVMTGAALPPLAGGSHMTVLPVSADTVRAKSARLCDLWRGVLVSYEPKDDTGRPAPGRPSHPYAQLIDFTEEPPEELHQALTSLTLAADDLLWHVLLGAPDPSVVYFRTYLLSVLRRRDLRIRFDSTLPVPWPLLCLPVDDDGDDHADDRADDHAGHDPADSPEAHFERFLAHRHQIEHTGGTYPCPGLETEPPRQPVVSLNHDRLLDRAAATRAAEVAALLATGTAFTERTDSAALLRALASPELNEQVMYFWCHGSFADRHPGPAQLVIRLSDARPIDADAIEERRRRLRGTTPFQPFVLLNACNAGRPADSADRSCLGRALIQHGARGVLGPLVEMPQRFAAEYALAFLTRYLGGTETAGRIAHDLARHFATTYRNPLAFAYALHCGMDSRLELAPELPPAPHSQELTV